MSWRIRITTMEDFDRRSVAGEDVVGLAYPVVSMRSRVSKDYTENRRGKPLWYIALPGIPSSLNRNAYEIFCPDMNYDGHEWTVVGEMPDITVSPSIHLVGVYHGFIKNGEITDDVDGRKYQL